MFYVYMLRCSDGSYYTGHTDNLEKRLYEHNEGIFKNYTETRRPVRLVFQQVFNTRDDAFRAEVRIKGWSRKKKEALIKNDWLEISVLSRRKGSRNPSDLGAQGERRGKGSRSRTGVGQE
ncbi:excinuclease ABC subunit C [Chitinispirillum alkaliphilum]|nr:excinuclease ABC subunit C [Chitinispirillum alkaliphilum]